MSDHFEILSIKRLKANKSERVTQGCSKIVKNVSHNSYKIYAKNFNLLSKISHFMTSQPGKNKSITINVLPNISRSKTNQTMKFVLLIEYNVRNNFL